jgi:hypothetical protein
LIFPRLYRIRPNQRMFYIWHLSPAQVIFQNRKYKSMKKVRSHTCYKYNKCASRDFFTDEQKFNNCEFQPKNFLNRRDSWPRSSSTTSTSA